MSRSPPATRRSKAGRARSDKAPYRIASARDVTTLSLNRIQAWARLLPATKPCPVGGAEHALLRSLPRAESLEHRSISRRLFGVGGGDGSNLRAGRMSRLRAPKVWYGLSGREGSSFSKHPSSGPKGATIAASFSALQSACTSADSVCGTRRAIPLPVLARQSTRPIF